MSSEAWALDLLKSADRCDVDPLRKQRVRLKVARAIRRRAFPVWRMSIVVGVVVGVVGGTALAGAALGRWPAWAVRAYERLRSPSPDAPVHARPPVPTTTLGHQNLLHRPTAGEGSIDTGLTPPPSVAADGAAGSASLVANRGLVQVEAGQHHRTLAATRAIRRPAPPTDGPGGDDTDAVLTAMRVLRRDKDPVRARVLLRGYLRDHPNGALAEEALAISVEAATAHADADAVLLASRYLQLYPSGPFRGLAERTISARR